MHRLTETIAIKICTLEGRTTKYLPPTEAVEFIIYYCKANGMWIYLDGRNVSYDRLNAAMLKQAKNIVLAEVVVGG